MAMERRSGPVRKKPSFFKFLAGDFSKQLKIPPDFVVHFDGEVFQQACLRTSSGTWCVDVEHVNNKLIFRKGWKEFVQANGLSLCQLLVFKYAGNFQFSVDIYGTDGCQKEIPMAHRKRGRPRDEEQGTESEDNVDNQSLTPVKDEVTDDTESESPSFEVEMCHSYIRNGYLAIPAKFSKAHFIEQPSSVTLRVSDGSTWPIDVVYKESASRCRFTGGWAVFRRKNDLKVGDVCAFFLIDKINFALEVDFYRKKEGAALSSGKRR